MESFLFNRTQTVTVDGKESNELHVKSGVPQGTVLGPLLFLIYINDINDDLTPGTKLRLFADDSFLYRQIKSKTDSMILQKDLETLQKWEKKWKMEFHPDKCQVLTITNKRSPIKSDYYIHAKLLKETKHAKYLGVIIDSKLQWVEQNISVCKKANSILAKPQHHRPAQKPQPKEEYRQPEALTRPELRAGLFAKTLHAGAFFGYLNFCWRLQKPGPGSS